MAVPLLAELYRCATRGEGAPLAPFVSAAFADLLRSCPGLAASLFGDLVPMPDGVPEVLTDVPGSIDTTLDILIEGESGGVLLIENRLSPDTDWCEERVDPRTPAHADKYIACARHRFGGRARLLVLARTEPDLRGRRYPSELFAGTRTWPWVYTRLEGALEGAQEVPAHLIRRFLYFLKDHDMNPSEPLSDKNVDTILAFDHLARNHLKLLDEALGRIRQEFDLRAIPNNRRLTGWYACSDRFQSNDLHFFFYLMFPPAPDLVARAAVQVTKESAPRAFAAAAEHGFRKGRWGSLWVERDFRRHHPFLSLGVQRQVEELVRFFQTPLARLAKAGLVREAPARHPEAGEPAAASPQTRALERAGEPGSTAGEPETDAGNAGEEAARASDPVPAELRQPSQAQDGGRLVD